MILLSTTTCLLSSSKTDCGMCNQGDFYQSIANLCFPPCSSGYKTLLPGYCVNSTIINHQPATNLHSYLGSIIINKLCRQWMFALLKTLNVLVLQPVQADTLPTDAVVFMEQEAPMQKFLTLTFGYTFFQLSESLQWLLELVIWSKNS